MMLRRFLLNGTYPAMREVYLHPFMFVLYLILTIAVETFIVYLFLPEHPSSKSVIFSFIIANSVSAAVGLVIYVVVFS